MGNGNENGYYYMKRREDASFVIQYIDYATCTDVTLCNRPECAHDNESCGAWRPYGGSSGGMFPVGESLYTIFYGSLDSRDYTRYGESAKMHIEKSALDGSGTKTILSLSAAETLNGGIAADAQNLYMTITTVEGSGEQETRRYSQIYMVDLQNGDIRKSEPMKETAIHIVGAAERKLVLCYYEMGQQKLSDTVIHYCTYDVDTGERANISFAVGESARCIGNCLCWIDREKNTLEKADVLNGDVVSIPLNIDISLYEDARLSYPLSHYTNIFLYDADKTEQRALISLNDGTVYPLTLEMDTPEDTPNQIIPIFAEINEQTFLVAQAFSYHPVQFSSEGAPLYLPVVDYTLALLPIESCLANSEDYLPVQELAS